MYIYERMKNEENDNWIWTDNNIGAEGAKWISESLKTNTTLTKLNLWGDEKLRMKWNEK